MGSINCLMFHFLIKLVDCVWGNWQNGTCSKTCGDGEVTRTRSKKVEAANGGNDCDGESVVLENCTSQPCPRKYF